MSGQRLEIHEELGRGGQGVVFRATLVHPSGPRRQVALKHLMPSDDIRFAGSAIRRLRSEATALAALNHPAIPDFVDLFAVDGSLAMAVRFVDGTDLSTLLSQGYALTPRAVAELVARVADALAFAWDAPGPSGAPLHLVHRDLKPSNLMLDHRGEPWVLDFGLAKSPELRRAGASETVGLLGSPGYLAPERYRGGGGGPAGDVFALGVIGLEALGAAPLLPHRLEGVGPDVRTDPAAWAARVERRVAELPQVPEPLTALLTSMLAWEPAARPGAAAARSAALALRETLPGPGLADWYGSLAIDPAAPPAQTRLVVPAVVGAAPAVADAVAGAGVSAGGAAAWTTRAGAAVVVVAGVALAWFSSGTPAADAPITAAPASTVMPVHDAAVSQGVPTPVRPREEVREELLPAVVEPVDAAPAPVPRRPSARTVEPPDVSEPAPSPGTAPAVAEAPATPPAPEPEPAPSARWSAEGTVPVRLTRRGAVAGPGPLQPGVWRAQADFGSGYVDAGEVVVPQAGEVTVQCMPWLGLCEVVP